MKDPVDASFDSEVSALRERIDQYSWYHSVEILPGLSTPGIQHLKSLQQPIAEALDSISVAGKRVLDIGCRDGLFCFQAESLGASEVIGIDNDLSRGAVEFLIPFKRSNVKMRSMNLMDLKPDTFGTFDLIIFAGVLYHLRYPFWALKLIRDVMRDGATLIIETGMYTLHQDEPLLFCPVGEESPYEPTSVTFFNLKGLTETLASLGFVVKSHRYLGAPQIPHDRCTVICEFSQRTIRPELVSYWDGTHELNSNFEANRRFLAGS